MDFGGWWTYEKLKFESNEDTWSEIWTKNYSLFFSFHVSAVLNIAIAWLKIKTRHRRYDDDEDCL